MPSPIFMIVSSLTILCDLNSYIALDELKNLMKNLGEGLNENEIAGMEKVAAADDENQVRSYTQTNARAHTYTPTIRHRPHGTGKRES
jgi:hypothetical protein